MKAITIFQHIKINNKIMKRFVRENLYESIKNEIDPKLGPYGYDIPDELGPHDFEDEEISSEEISTELDTSDMEKTEEIEVDDDYSFQLEDALNAELQLKDFNREPFNFRIIPREKDKRGKIGKIIHGTVMAKLKNDNYVFKLDDNSMRKFNINDIVMLEENVKITGNKLNERIKDGYEYEYVDYLFDIATFLMLHPENVQAILNINDVYDEEEAKIEITNELEDNDDIYGTKGMYATGIEAEDAALKIVNQYQG